MTNLTDPIYNDEATAREHFENIRWPDGPVCPHCGTIDRVKPLGGKSMGPGWYHCGACRDKFTVRVGTVYERSKIPLHKWILATHLLAASKKGMSAHQLHRMLGVTYKTAWFMTHRIRKAMRETSSGLGGGGSTVEVDETYWGNTKPRGQKKGRGGEHKEKVLTLLERKGRAHSFHVPKVNAETLRPIIKEQIKADTHIMTDEAAVYCLSKEPLSKDFQSHNYVRHNIGEYVRGDIYTNTIENCFSILKRGLTGTYQHVSKTLLKRYLCEFDFRYNYRYDISQKTGYNDMERTNVALKGIEGKRLTYCQVTSR